MLPSMGTWWAALSHLFMGSSSCYYRCVRTCSWPPASPVCAQSSRPAPTASARALSQCLWGPRGSCGWCFQLRNTQPAPLPPDATLRWGISLRLAPSLGPPWGLGHMSPLFSGLPGRSMSPLPCLAGLCLGSGSVRTLAPAQETPDYLSLSLCLASLFSSTRNVLEITRSGESWKLWLPLIFHLYYLCPTIF